MTFVLIAPEKIINGCTLSFATSKKALPFSKETFRSVAVNFTGYCNVECADK